MKSLFTVIVSLLCLTSFGQVATSVTNGLVGWWLPFGTNASGTNVVDWSGQGNNGTTTNSPYWTNSITGTTNALNFNGVDQHIIIPSNSSLFTTSRTVSSWVVPNLTTNDYSVVIKTAPEIGTPDCGLYLKLNGKLAIYVTGSDNTDYDGTGTHTLTNGGLYNIAFTYSSASGLAGYVNGELDGTALSVGNMTNSGSTFIGSDQVTPGRDLNAKVADVRVYNRALPQSEIILLYHECQPWTKMYIGQPMGLFQRIAKP